MNKISFTIPNTIPNTNKDKIEPNNPFELTNQIIIKPKTIKNKNITDYKKLAPNVYKFC